METMTLAIKAKRLLDAHGIGCEIVSIDPSVTKKGCAYALRLGCGYVMRATAMMGERRISYGEIIGR